MVDSADKSAPGVHEEGVRTKKKMKRLRRSTTCGKRRQSHAMAEQGRRRGRRKRCEFSNDMKARSQSRASGRGLGKNGGREREAEQGEGTRVRKGREGGRDCGDMGGGSGPGRSSYVSSDDGSDVDGRKKFWSRPAQSWSRPGEKEKGGRRKNETKEVGRRKRKRKKGVRGSGNCTFE